MQIQHPISASSAHSKLSLEFRLNSYYWFTCSYIFAFHIANKGRSFSKMGLMPYGPHQAAEKLFLFQQRRYIYPIETHFQNAKEVNFQTQADGTFNEWQNFF